MSWGTPYVQCAICSQISNFFAHGLCSVGNADFRELFNWSVGLTYNVAPDEEAFFEGLVSVGTHIPSDVGAWLTGRQVLQVQHSHFIHTHFAPTAINVCIIQLIRCV
jgi:hypothetical protein